MTSFDEFFAEIVVEAEAEGPQGVSRITSLDTFYRLPRELQQARLAKGFTQKQLGELSGLGQPDISRIENGEINITIGTLGALAGALGLEVQLVPRGSKT